MKPFVPIYETFPQWIGGRAAIEHWMPQKFCFVIDHETQGLRLYWGGLKFPFSLGLGASPFGFSVDTFLDGQSREFLGILKALGFDAGVYVGQPLDERTLRHVQAELDTVDLDLLMKYRCTLRDVALHLFGVTPCPRDIP